MDATTLAAILVSLDTERVLTAAVMVDGDRSLPSFHMQSAARTGRCSCRFRIGAPHSRSHPRHHHGTPSTGGHARSDAMQIPRLTVQATVSVLERDDCAFDEAARASSSGSLTHPRRLPRLPAELTLGGDVTLRDSRARSTSALRPFAQSPTDRDRSGGSPKAQRPECQPALGR